MSYSSAREGSLDAQHGSSDLSDSISLAATSGSYSLQAQWPSPISSSQPNNTNWPGIMPGDTSHNLMQPLALPITFEEPASDLTRVLLPVFASSDLGESWHFVKLRDIHSAQVIKRQLFAQFSIIPESQKFYAIWQRLGGPAAYSLLSDEHIVSLCQTYDRLAPPLRFCIRPVVEPVSDPMSIPFRSLSSLDRFQPAQGPIPLEERDISFYTKPPGWAYAGFDYGMQASLWPPQIPFIPSYPDNRSNTNRMMHSSQKNVGSNDRRKGRDKYGIWANNRPGNWTTAPGPPVAAPYGLFGSMYGEYGTIMSEHPGPLEISTARSTSGGGPPHDPSQRNSGRGAPVKAFDGQRDREIRGVDEDYSATLSGAKVVYEKQKRRRSHSPPLPPVARKTEQIPPASPLWGHLHSSPQVIPPLSGDRPMKHVTWKADSVIHSPVEEHSPEIILEKTVDLTGAITVANEVMEQGGYSSIYLGNWKGQTVAVKALRVIVNEREKWERRLRREVLVLASLDHPNITPLYGVTTTQMSPLPAMWYNNGSASKYLHNCDLPITGRIKICMDIADGLCYLHSLNTVHGDLKPANVLIDDAGNARLCDFGLASLLGEEAGGGFTTTTEYVGTARYTAPELFNAPVDTVGYKPTPASDIFSLGCVIYEITTCNPPYPMLRSSNRLGAQILLRMMKRMPPATPSDELDKAISGCAPALWSLFNCCWNYEPASRPAVSALVADFTMIQQDAETAS